MNQLQDRVAAVEGLTRSLIHDGRAYGVVASVIHPGAGRPVSRKAGGPAPERRRRNI